MIHFNIFELLLMQYVRTEERKEWQKHRKRSVFQSRANL